MRVCREYQFAKIQGFELGWSPVGQPMMTTHCYTLGDLMVDTGQAHMQKEVIQIAQNAGVRQVVLTHHHEDHSGNAAMIKNQLGACVFGNALTARKMATRFNIFPYQKYVWGKSSPLQIDPFPEEIKTCFGPLIPVHAPGHSKDHMVYYLKDEGILFSGDLYLADRIKFFRADEDMGSQIASLKKILALDFDMILCGHFPKKNNGKHHIQNKLMFLEDLYGSITQLREQGLEAKQIFKTLNLKEARFVKYFCFGNVSMMNGVRSAIRHYEKQQSDREQGRGPAPLF